MPQEQAHRDARPGGGGGRDQVPRPVRGAPEGGHERDPRVEGHDHLHRRAAHHRRRRAARRARSTPPTCSSRRWRAASCSASARPRSTSTASTSRRTARSSGASRRSWSTRRPSRRRSQILHGPARQVRGAPPREDHRRGAGAGGEARGPLHHRPLPPRQGDRRDRRGRRAGAALGDHRADRDPRARAEARGGRQGEGGRDPRPGVREGRAPARQGEGAAQRGATSCKKTWSGVQARPGGPGGRGR